MSFLILWRFMHILFWLILPAPLPSHLPILLFPTVPFRPQGSILFHFVLLFPPLPSRRTPPTPISSFLVFTHVYSCPETLIYPLEIKIYVWGRTNSISLSEHALSYLI